MTVIGIGGGAYWHKPEDQLPTMTKKYYVTWDDPSDDKYLKDSVALFRVDTGKFSINGVEVTVLVWGDPDLFPET